MFTCLLFLQAGIGTGSHLKNWNRYRVPTFFNSSYRNRLKKTTKTVGSFDSYWFDEITQHFIST